MPMLSTLLLFGSLHHASHLATEIQAALIKASDLTCKTVASTCRQEDDSLSAVVHTWRLDMKVRGGVREGVAPGVEE